MYSIGHGDGHILMIMIHVTQSVTKILIMFTIGRKSIQKSMVNISFVSLSCDIDLLQKSISFFGYAF